MIHCRAVLPRPRCLAAVGLASSLLVGGPLAAAPPPPAASARPVATVQEILDRPEFYIGPRQARVGDQARVPDPLRTGYSRGQLRFPVGGAGRINRFSHLRLGSSCFVVERGQVLVSGPQKICTPSLRLSTRGTHYLVAVGEDGGVELTVLEGRVEARRWQAAKPSGDPPTTVAQGQQGRFSAAGTLLTLRPLTGAEVAALLAGPLFAGFRTPWPGADVLRSQLQRSYPGLEPAALAPAEATPLDPLVARINALRLLNGRPPLQPLPPHLSQLYARTMDPVLSGILSGGDCDHDRVRWEGLQSATAAAGERLRPTSELIACPLPRTAWNPDRVLSRWLSSQFHTDLLLNRPRATHIDCVNKEEQGRVVAMCSEWSPAVP